VLEEQGLVSTNRIGYDARPMKVGAALSAVLVIFGAVAAGPQTRAGHGRSATMTVSVTVVRSQPQTESASTTASTAAGDSSAPPAAATATANPSTVPVPAPPRHSETAASLVESTPGATASRVLTINY
jgi:hypothetical protein